MGHRETVDDYIRRFGERVGVTFDPVNDQGYCEITRGSARVRVNVLEDHGVLLFLAPLMKVPERNRLEFYRKLLELSFLATSDAAFAVDKKTEVAYLRIFRRLEGLDFDEFEDLLHTIALVADEWDDKLKDQFGS